jgi:hypothetical protein
LSGPGWPSKGIPMLRARGFAASLCDLIGIARVIAEKPRQ